eukprot:symbB.v1.2.007734.t1/scaffold457.1/size330934/4
MWQSRGLRGVLRLPPLVLRLAPRRALPVGSLPGSCRAFSDVPSFDVFAKIKDPPEEGATGSNKRKPSEKAKGEMATTEPVGYVAPKVVTSSCLCGGQVLHFHVMQLDGQVFLWIGGEQKGFDDLHIATPTRFDPLPSVASLRGEVDGNASSLSQKLSRRFGLMVLRLVDEIMSLTLIEAADLCDLCQEKLAPGDGAPIPGRMPFPHPMGMFPGMPMPGAMPAMPMPGVPAVCAPAAAPAAAPAEAPAEEEAPKEEAKKEEKKKEIVAVKLVSFEAAKKINVVKEVRAITQIGLKEAKELVESAPKVVKKGVPIADAEAMRDKLAAAGAEIALE